MEDKYYCCIFTDYEGWSITEHQTLEEAQNNYNHEFFQYLPKGYKCIIKGKIIEGGLI